MRRCGLLVSFESSARRLRGITVGIGDANGYLITTAELCLPMLTEAPDTKRGHIGKPRCHCRTRNKRLFANDSNAPQRILLNFAYPVLHGMTALYCVRLLINPGPVPPRNRGEKPRDPSFVAWQSSSFFIPFFNRFCGWGGIFTGASDKHIPA